MQSSFFNSLFQFVTEEERFHREMVPAKREFEQVAGPIYDSDAGYAARINAFHNWYILDRPLSAKGRTPLEYFLEFNANSLPPDVLRGYQELGQNLHSVFELVKLGEKETWLRDLMTNRKFAVQGHEEMFYLDRGAVFNTRLFRHGGAYYPSNYLIVHPAEMLKRIKQEARQVIRSKGDHKEFLFRLILFQSRWDQYRQMEVEKIYRFTT